MWRRGLAAVKTPLPSTCWLEQVRGHPVQTVPMISASAGSSQASRTVAMGAHPSFRAGGPFVKNSVKSSDKDTSRTGQQAAPLSSPPSSSTAPQSQSTEPGNRMQKLYNLAKLTFSGNEVPSHQAVSQILQAMCSMPLEELGLDEQSRCRRRLSSDSHASDDCQGSITYLKVHEDANLDIGIFCLPANSVIPLHNHPGMTVLSRLLYGEIHVRAYQWCEKEEDAGPRERGLSQLVTDSILKGKNATSVCFPEKANIHAFKALTDCAILDVMSPPYDSSLGRECTYYKEILPKSVQILESGLILRGTGMDIELQACDPCVSFRVHQGFYDGLKVNAKLDE